MVTKIHKTQRPTTRSKRTCFIESPRATVKIDSGHVFTFLPWALKCPWTNSWRKGGEKQKGNPNGENYCFSHGTNRQLPPILKIGKTTLFYPNSDFLSPSDPSETCGYLPISSSFSQSPKTPKETFDCRTLFHTDSLSRSSNNLNGKRTIISAAIGELEAAFLYL